MKIKMADRKKHVLSKVVKNIIFQNKTLLRDAKFPGILKAVSFHREYWKFCWNIGNFREYMETLGILK